MEALRSNRPRDFKDLLSCKIEIDAYIYFNLGFHWADKDKRGDEEVARHFDTANSLFHHYVEVKNLNSAITKLSDGIMADCFNEEGAPVLGIISPIQALIINRVFCLHMDFVRMLWEYDKQNMLVNAVMIWILINGILKEKIYARESGFDELVKAKEYFASAIKSPLDQIINEGFWLLKERFELFKGKELIHAAGDGKFCNFLSHTVAKRHISYEWNPYGRKKPRRSLYIHMTMYVVSYLMLAYHTLRQSGNANSSLQWILFTMILSLFVDEVRQALGEDGCTINISLQRWWLDSWNKLDILSMALYFTAFGLECGGVVSVSHLLFSTFSFIWCLKFYQFLRAFESLGIYIILVQKMLPQLTNFAVVAFVAIISYGVFMTSILFPNIKFESWSVFIMILLRPYLLLFAETGINEYDLSAKTTIYNTPKIQTTAEIIMVLGMCVFLMFGGVLLLNLLIAIFSGIYEDVKAESERIWAMHDFQLLQEMQLKPVLPIPFSLPVNIYRIVKRLTSKAEVFESYGRNDYKLRLGQYELIQEGFQGQEGAKEVEANQSLKRRIDKVEQKLDELPETISKSIDIRIKNVENQCQEISILLKELIKKTDEKSV